MVKARGNYELDKYYVQNSLGRFIEIPRKDSLHANTVDVPTVRLADQEYGDSSYDEETSGKR